MPTRTRPNGDAVGNMPGIPEREELSVLEIVRPVEVADLRVEVDPLAVAVEPERTHDLRIFEGSDAAVERIDRTRLGQLPAGIDRCGRLQMVGRRLLHGRELAGAVSHRTQGDHIADGVQRRIEERLAALLVEDLREDAVPELQPVIDRFVLRQIRSLPAFRGPTLLFQIERRITHGRDIGGLDL